MNSALNYKSFTYSLYLQNALIVGDFMRNSDNWLLQYANLATELITWFRSKTQLLGLLEKVQLNNQEMTNNTNNGNPLTIIRPVATRWTAYFMAFRRLSELSWAL